MYLSHFKAYCSLRSIFITTNNKIIFKVNRQNTDYSVTKIIVSDCPKMYVFSGT